MRFGGEKKGVMEHLLFSLIVFSFIIISVGSVGADPICTPEQTQSCGSGSCAGTQTCLPDGSAWGACSTSGDNCGSCMTNGCGDILNYLYGVSTLSYKYYNLIGGTLTCNSQGQCVNTCGYNSGICADEILIDQYPWASCHAGCDQDSDCPLYSYEGDICYYDRFCNSNSCQCGYNNNQPCPSDGNYCNGNVVEVRDYSCGVNGCKYTISESQNCNDGNVCNGQETCSAGSCVSGTSLTCDDGAWCNGAETCDSVSGCQQGTAPDCNDGVGCTVDSCDEDADNCVHSPNDVLCQDGAWCNGAETCNAQNGCQSGTSVDCSGNNLASFSQCNYNPDDKPFTLDVFLGFISTCDETKDSCTTYYQWDFLTHECNKQQCGAGCDSTHSCDNKCGIGGDLDIFYSGGICDLSSTCTCSWTQTDCNINDCLTGIQCVVNGDTMHEEGDDYSCVSNTGASCGIFRKKQCNGPWICNQQCTIQVCGGNSYTCYGGTWQPSGDVGKQEICNNQIDDDCDGKTDCDDSDCMDSTSPITTKSYGTPFYSSSEYPPFSTSIGNQPVAVNVEDLGDKLKWTIDFPVEGDSCNGLMAVGLVIATNGEGNGPKFQIHNNDGSDSSFNWGTWLYSPWGPTISDGWFGWHSSNNNTLVSSLDWVEATGNRYYNDNPNGVFTIIIDKSKLGENFHWALYTAIGSGFCSHSYQQAYYPASFSWGSPIVSNTNYEYAQSVGGYPKWITSATEITLTATDIQGPEGECVSGLDKTYYRVTLLESNDACFDQQLCQTLTGAGTFLPYIPFKIVQDSCHLIEYYSVDNKGVSELIKKQCIFVDNLAPATKKVVGEVKTKWYPNEFDDDYETSYFYPETAHCWDGTGEEIECWKVTLDTPINITCADDPEPHPVGFDKLCFKVSWDAVDVTQSYCSLQQGYIMNDLGYCCGVEDIIGFKFKEESEHNLEYYCEDKLGNKQYDDEKFKVFGNMYEIYLKKKWNLISVPFDPLNKEPEEVFSEVEDNIDSVWSYDAEMKKWNVYRPDAPPETNNLDEIKTGLGYWIMALNDDTLRIGGSLISPGNMVPPAIKIVKGWNLIGHYGTGSKEVYCSLLSLVDTQQGFPRWSSLWGYNSSSQSVIPLDFLSASTYPGKGYWMEIDVNESYSPSSGCVYPK